MTEKQSPTVIHLDPEFHARVKAHCQQRDLRMKDFATQAMTHAMARDSRAVVKGKQLEQLDYSRDFELWSRPPFWATRNRSG